MFGCVIEPNWGYRRRNIANFMCISLFSIWLLESYLLHTLNLRRIYGIDGAYIDVCVRGIINVTLLQRSPKFVLYFHFYTEFSMEKNQIDF